VSGDGFATELALVALLIVLNGFFAGAEIAVISARPSRVRPLAERGDRRALALLRLKSDPDRFLATVQIGVTVVGTLASAVGGVAAVERLEPVFAAAPISWVREAAEPLAVGCIVFLISYASLVVGELVPKSLAVRHAETLALVVARPVERLSRITRIAVGVLTASTRALLRLIGQKTQVHIPFHSLEDLRAIVREAEVQGLVAGALVRGVFEIQDREVRALMTPRSHVVGIPRAATLAEALQIVKDSGYSRFPVYGRTPDHVLGIAFAREFYEAAQGGQTGGIDPFIRPTLLVPERRTAFDLLGEMRRAQLHMALIVDEHGVMVGVVTLEDLFEVVVGSIEDERDVPRPRVQRLADGCLLADGMTSLRELNSAHGLRLPESDHYVTIAGLVLEHLGSLPHGGEVIEIPLQRLTVVGVGGKRITHVRIEPHLPPAQRTTEPT
jgi:putative hemolysin